MEITSYLVFRLQDSRYAVEASAVVEIVPLPEIFRLEEAPGYVVGVANLRGRIVPVIDPNLRFGHPPRPYRLDDSIVVLGLAGRMIGIVVDEAQTVRDFAPEEILSASLYISDESEAASRPDPRFLRGLVKSEGQVVMLLHLENLLRLTPSLAEQPGEEGVAPPRAVAVFFPDATPEERTAFQERSRRLSRPAESEEREGSLALAVVRLGEELFGIELHTIREFAKLGNVTPVPCCPDHIVGQMNLRGEIITVVNIAGTLGLPPLKSLSPSGERLSPLTPNPSPPEGRGELGSKVVVMDSAQLRAGVLVDELLDVVYLHADDMRPPAHLARESRQEHLRGTATHGSRTLSLIDLPALLSHGSLVVTENPR